MAHFAFFSFPGVGHVTPLHRLVGELTGRGHRVTFAVADHLAKLLDGSTAEPLRYHSDFPQKVPEVHTADDATHMIIDLIREGFAPLADALARLAGDRPDVIVYDTIHPNTARILARAWNRPKVQVFPVFAMNERKEIPGAPEPDPGHPASTGFDPADPRLAALGEELGPRVADLLTGYGIDPEQAMASLDGGDEDLHLVLLPRAFQFGGETFGERYRFVGSTADDTVVDEAWTPPGDGRPVVLVSVSTAAKPRTEVFREFAAACADRPWHVVMTMGRGFDLSELGALPPNVEAREWIPHTAVLPHTAAVVSSAGMGSVLASLRYATPMVALPETQEQMVNGHRLVQLGLGRCIPIDAVTGPAVAAAIAALLDDAEVPARLAWIREQDEQAGGAKRAADELEALL